jgi:hypothetical protein
MTQTPVAVAGSSTRVIGCHARTARSRDPGGPCPMGWKQRTSSSDPYPFWTGRAEQSQGVVSHDPVDSRMGGGEWMDRHLGFASST